MHSLLTKLLSSRNIKSFDELDKDEKKTFEGFQKVLSKEEMTMDDLQNFLESQISLIESKWRDFDSKGKESLIPYHTTYKAILQAIKAPQSEREQIEKYLTDLIKQHGI